MYTHIGLAIILSSGVSDLSQDTPHYMTGYEPAEELHIHPRPQDIVEASYA
jgi:hypothetical protein